MTVYGTGAADQLRKADAHRRGLETQSDAFGNGFADHAREYVQALPPTAARFGQRRPLGTDRSCGEGNQRCPNVGTADVHAQDAALSAGTEGASSDALQDALQELYTLVISVPCMITLRLPRRRITTRWSFARERMRFPSAPSWQGSKPAAPEAMSGRPMGRALRRSRSAEDFWPASRRRPVPG